MPRHKPPMRSLPAPGLRVPSDGGAGARRKGERRSICECLKMLMSFRLAHGLEQFPFSQRFQRMRRRRGGGNLPLPFGQPPAPGLRTATWPGVLLLVVGQPCRTASNDVNLPGPCETFQKPGPECMRDSARFRGIPATGAGPPARGKARGSHALFSARSWHRR